MMDLEKARKILEIKDIEPERILDLSEAIWIYQGKPGEPHALLTSGKHSDGYINLNAVLQFPNLCEILAKSLIRKIKEEGIDNTKIDAVVSSSYAAITLGQEVARQLRVMFVFTEKEKKEQKWSGRFKLPKRAKLLQVEDLISTLGTTRKVKEAILKQNPDVSFLEREGKTVVATVIHRPEKLPKIYPDYSVIALMEREIHVWESNECPLCKRNSPVLKAKPNWERFIKHQ
jgi:orotate phosphoribosyltransferase